MIWFLIVPLALMMALAVAGFVSAGYDILRHDQDRGLFVFVMVLGASMLVGITFATI